jgi:uncharacterized membrane protein YjjB (DUF3815 family)
LDPLYFLPCLWALVASMSFSVFFNIHGSGVLICGLGGALGWLVYLLSAPLFHSEVLQSFLAAIAISVYSEVMSRVRKCPVTGYLLVAFFPLVPGGGIYYTMEHAISGETQQFIETGLHTLGVAGSLAVGVLLVSSAVRMWSTYRRRLGELHP